MKKITTICLFLSTSFASAHQGETAIQGKMSTLGLGAEISHQLSDTFSILASLNGFKSTRGLSSSDISTNGKLRLLTTGFCVGVHPFRNSFKVVLGVFYNDNKYKLNARLNRTITFNGVNYSPDSVGNVKGSIYYNHISPYMGIGFDAPICSNQLRLAADLGVLFQGTPKSKANSSNGLNSNVRSYLKRALRNSADRPLLNYYPVISVGLKYVL